VLITRFQVFEQLLSQVLDNSAKFSHPFYRDHPILRGAFAMTPELDRI